MLHRRLVKCDRPAHLRRYLECNTPWPCDGCSRPCWRPTIISHARQDQRQRLRGAELIECHRLEFGDGLTIESSARDSSVARLVGSYQYWLSILLDRFLR